MERVVMTIEQAAAYVDLNKDLVAKDRVAARCAYFVSCYGKGPKFAAITEAQASQAADAISGFAYRQALKAIHV